MISGLSEAKLVIGSKQTRGQKGVPRSAIEIIHALQINNAIITNKPRLVIPFKASQAASSIFLFVI